MNMTANKHYSVGEIYAITREAVRTVPFLRATRLGRDRQFTERIQLAVTEVNGCALCSYAHTRFALEAGLSTEEIRALLGGVTQGAPEHQLPAIAFAQHYADTRGHPEAQDWQAVVDYYGEDEALSVLAATRVMMWGNAFAIPMSSLLARLKGEPHPESTLSYEILTTLGAVGVAPAALLSALVSRLNGMPVSPQDAASTEIAG